jgi:hypothetical protein
MKSIFTLFITVLIIISCKSSDRTKEVNYDDFIDTKTYLVGIDSNYESKDSLALVSLKIHQRFDTAYNWWHRSDCLPCGWMKYRFADKSYPQLKQDDWFGTFADSSYQLDIWHKPIKEAPDSITLKPKSEKDTSFCDYHPNIFWIPDSIRFLFKKFRIINSRPFIISAFISLPGRGKFANPQTLIVVAETNLKSRELYFVGECRAKDTTGFIDKTYKSFLSIKIEEKQ